MHLVIDSGNTDIVFGIFRNENLKYQFRINSKANRSAEKISLKFNNFLKTNRLRSSDICSVIISNVVPSIDHILKTFLKSYTDIKTLWINSDIKLPFKLLIDNPSEIGPDLIAGTAGALLSNTPPLVIIDMGTATTFLAVNKNKNITGVAISPGLMIFTESLYNSIPHLPVVNLEEPVNIIGKNTGDSLRSGIFSAYICLIEGMVTKFKKVLGKNTKVISTGGLSGILKGKTDIIYIFDPDIVIKGLFFLNRLQ